MLEKDQLSSTPAQERFMEFRRQAEEAMFASMSAAIDEAVRSMAENLRGAGIEIPSTDQDYFTFAAQQFLFVRLCGGNFETLLGGDPEIGQRIVNNGQHIIDHYWRGAGK